MTVRHPVFARFYSRFVVPGIERRGGTDLRRRNLAGLTGTVVEVGAGDGVNFGLYPDAVERIVALEPEPYLRERAARHADERVELRAEPAEELPLDDDEADAVVFSLVLCTVDQDAALAQARRVLRPGGELRFLEHVQTHEAGPMRRVRAGRSSASRSTSASTDRCRTAGGDRSLPPRAPHRRVFGRGRPPR